LRNPVSCKYDKNNGYNIKKPVYIHESISLNCSLDEKYFRVSEKKDEKYFRVSEKKMHISYSINVFENYALCENMWK